MSMTKELLNTLSTGDVVTNAKTSECKMVFVIVSSPNNISVEKLTADFGDWELTKSRTYITERELQEIAAYHKKMEEDSKQ